MPRHFTSRTMNVSEESVVKNKKQRQCYNKLGPPGCCLVPFGCAKSPAEPHARPHFSGAVRDPYLPMKRRGPKSFLHGEGLQKERIASQAIHLLHLPSTTFFTQHDLWARERPPPPPPPRLLRRATELNPPRRTPSTPGPSARIGLITMET